VKLVINKPTFILYLFSFYCFICFQLTEIKINSVKINEIISLLLVPVIIYQLKVINKHLFYFLLFFLFILLVTIIKNLTQTFYLDTSALTILRKPYLISISRFFEFLACFAFAVIVWKTFVYLISKGLTKDRIVNAILSLNFYFSLLLIIAYLLYYFRILNYFNAQILYDTTAYLPEPTLRLKGYYIEGGPFGLFYAFLFCLSSTVNKRKYFQKAIFLVMIFLALSKAGMIAVVGWFFYRLFVKFRNNILTKYIIFLLIIPAFILIAFKIADNYSASYNGIKEIITENPADYNAVMGRLAAFFIAPNMIIHNPFLGIGLGNYPLVRNDPRYLGVIPEVPEWDLPGLGGLVTLLIENGIISFLIFLLILYIIYKKYSKKSPMSKDSILLFIIICSLGVQLYFLYIWFLIGLAVTPEKEYLIDERL